MSKSKPEKILGERVFFPIWKDIVAFAIITAIVIAVVVLGYKYEFESPYVYFPWILEFVFLIIFVVDLIPKKKNNSLPQYAITTDGDYIIVYQKNEKIYIEFDAIQDMDYKNKKGHVVAPYYYSETVYNYGKVRLFVLDGNNIKKLVVKNVFNPDRVIEKIASVLEWDIFVPEDEDAYLIDDNDADN